MDLEYSILRGCKPRPLAVALAHELCRPRLSQGYRAVLWRLYGSLPAAQQAECRAALVRLLLGGVMTPRCAALQIPPRPAIFPTEQGRAKLNAAEGSQYRPGAG